jgi:hypothetical protein
MQLGGKNAKNQRLSMTRSRFGSGILDATCFAIDCAPLYTELRSIAQKSCGLLDVIRDQAQIVRRST